MKTAHNLLLVTFLLSSAALAVEHRPLLPLPQKIRYGTGYLPLHSVVVRLTGGAGSEDLFAAQQLSACLFRHVRRSVAVVEGPDPAPAVFLNRTGAGDPLPLPDEKTGADSRESYTLLVAPEGAEIKAVLAVFKSKGPTF